MRLAFDPRRVDLDGSRVTFEPSTPVIDHSRVALQRMSPVFLEVRRPRWPTKPSACDARRHLAVRWRTYVRRCPPAPRAFQLMAHA